MQIINDEVLSRCIQQAVRAELQEHFRTGVSLVTLTDWMEKGLSSLRLNKRVYFKKSEVLAIMRQTDTTKTKNSNNQIRRYKIAL